MRERSLRVPHRGVHGEGRGDDRDEPQITQRAFLALRGDLVPAVPAARVSRVDGVPRQVDVRLDHDVHLANHRGVVLAVPSERVQAVARRVDLLARRRVQLGRAAPPDLVAAPQRLHVVQHVVGVLGAHAVHQLAEHLRERVARDGRGAQPAADLVAQGQEVGGRHGGARDELGDLVVGPLHDRDALGLRGQAVPARAQPVHAAAHREPDVHDAKHHALVRARRASRILPGARRPRLQRAPVRLQRGHEPPHPVQTQRLRLLAVELHLLVQREDATVQHPLLLIQRRRFLARKLRATRQPLAFLLALDFHRLQLQLVAPPQRLRLRPLGRRQTRLQLRVELVRELREAQVRAAQHARHVARAGRDVPGGRRQAELAVARGDVRGVDAAHDGRVLLQNGPRRLGARRALPLGNKARRLVEARVLVRAVLLRRQALRAAAVVRRQPELGHHAGRRRLKETPSDADGHLVAARGPQKLRLFQAPPRQGAGHRVPREAARVVVVRLAPQRHGFGRRGARGGLLRARRGERARAVDRAQPLRGLAGFPSERRRLREVRDERLVVPELAKHHAVHREERLGDAEALLGERADAAAPRLARAPRGLRGDSFGGGSVAGGAVRAAQPRRAVRAPQLGGVGDVVQHAEADHGRAGRLARLHALRGRAAHQRAADRVEPRRRRRDVPGAKRGERGVKVPVEISLGARGGVVRVARVVGTPRNAIQAKRARRRSGVRGVRARVLGVGQVPLADAPRRFEARRARLGGRRLLGGQRVDVDVQHVQTPHLPQDVHQLQARARGSRVAARVAGAATRAHVEPRQRLAPRALVLVQPQLHGQRVGSKQAVDPVRLGEARLRFQEHADVFRDALLVRREGAGVGGGVLGGGGFVQGHHTVSVFQPRLGQQRRRERRARAPRRLGGDQVVHLHPVHSAPALRRRRKASLSRVLGPLEPAALRGGPLRVRGCRTPHRRRAPEAHRVQRAEQRARRAGASPAVRFEAQLHARGHETVHRPPLPVLRGDVHERRGEQELGQRCVRARGAAGQAQRRRVAVFDQRVD